jgi:hypothetical protein
VGGEKRQPESFRNPLKRVSFQAAFTGLFTTNLDNVAGTNGDDTIDSSATVESTNGIPTSATTLNTSDQLAGHIEH